jgi:phage terminase large subunit-like protein
VRLACQRHLDDLARAGFDYVFRSDLANRFCRFQERLPHVKGTWKTKNIVLEPWQCFVYSCVFGWIDSEGHRRFRTGYVETPRKNAKSTGSAGVGIYLTCADGEEGPEVYSFATTRDQARIVFDVARDMVRKTPELQQALGLEVLTHALAAPGCNGTFRALSSDASTLDGLNIHGAIIDELHAHSTRAVWDVVNSATGSRRNALKWIITTAGFNRAGVCYEQHDYVCKLLERTIQDEHYFGIIYTIDEGDDWTAESSWRKANPNYGVSVLQEDIATLCHQAQLSAQSQNNFLTKRLNVWVSADTAFFNMQAWDRCRTDLRLEDFAGQPCIMGLDLAAKYDLAAKMLLFEREQVSATGTVERHYYLFGKYYLPEDEVEQGINTNAAHFSGWARAGRITLTPGNIIDYEFIERDILDDYGLFRVDGTVFDPREMTYLYTRLQAAGIKNLIEYPVNVNNYSDPMKEMEALILAGRLHHDGDPVLAWSISNVVAHTDAKEMIFPRKERVENKIDPVTAALAALGWKMRQRNAAASIYSDPKTCAI